MMHGHTPTRTFHTCSNDLNNDHKEEDRVVVIWIGHEDVIAGVSPSSHALVPAIAAPTPPPSPPLCMCVYLCFQRGGGLLTCPYRTSVRSPVLLSPSSSHVCRHTHTHAHTHTRTHTHTHSLSGYLFAFLQKKTPEAIWNRMKSQIDA